MSPAVPNAASRKIIASKSSHARDRVWVPSIFALRKYSFLIVEFATQAEDAGATVRDAAVQAARTRLRPILMTSLAFILGVVPLAVATGAGAEMRQSLGTAVFFGMLGVTLFGLLFTPTFYAVVRRLSGEASRSR